MVRVSVIVPVYNPGEHLQACVESLLAQTMPAGECELILVDDGSTDGSGARLDALAAAHEHVRVEHIPNSGWPGRPRNVGIDMARGEYVYFVDNDDWLGPEALERLHRFAALDDADIVVGKVSGHGKYVTRGVFAANRHGLTAEDAPYGLLTPHKLFRRALLAEHAIRFPEGRRRLEDHLFVVEAYFRASRISVLADYPCYHWVTRGVETNASLRRPPAAEYYRAVRDVLDLLDSHTEPGPLRDRLYGRWYRGKVIGRVGRGALLQREGAEREELIAEVRRLVEERFPPRFDEGLPYALGLRARLLRRGDDEGLGALARFESGLAARAPVGSVRGDGTWLTLRCRGRLWSAEGGPLQVERRDGRTLFCPPEALAPHLTDEDRVLPRRIGDGEVRALLRDEHGVEWELPTESRLRLPEPVDGQPVRPVVRASARIAPTIAAGGGPLAPGSYDVRLVVSMAGFSAVARLKSGDGPLDVEVSPALRVRPSVAPRPLRAVPPPPPPPPAGVRGTALRTAVRVPGLLPAVRRARRRALATARR